MSEIEYKMMMDAISVAGQLLAQHDLPALLDSMERADTVGPFVDPTLWMRGHGAMDKHREAVKAALPLWRLAREAQAKAATASEPTAEIK